MLAVALASPSLAGEVTVAVADPSGTPLADAVAALLPQSGAAPAKAALWSPIMSAVIDQRNETFLPLVTVIGIHGAVVFRNSDTVRHHVYTFSPIHPFEFVLVPGQSSTAERFDGSGVAAIGCNIHDQMIAYVYVSATPYVARTGSDGRAVLPAVPSGAYRLKVWHPRLRPGTPALERTVTVGAGPDLLAATLAVAPAMPMAMRHGRGLY